MAAELAMLEGGGQTETGACGAPQVRAHLRVAQASGTAELGPRAEASGTTGGPLRQRNGDPKRWSVRHRDGLEGGSERSRKRSRTVSVTGDRNAELCTGCGKGGHLYCCDGCPRVWHAGCLHGKGGVPQKSEGRWYGPCCSQERAGVGVLPTSGQRRSTIGKERGAGTVGQGGQEGGSEIGDVPAGVLGLHMRYVYTGKRSERSPYIAERAKSMHNLTRNEMLQRAYKDRRGVCVPYQERDLRYDAAHGYLRQEGGDQASKGGVLHRGPVGTRKRGRDGAEGEGRKRGRGQAAALPRDQGKAGRPTQTRKRSRESPVRMARRTRQREHPVTPTQAPRPAPDISKKMRPKNGDKEG